MERAAPHHACHWPGCKEEVSPRLWGCKMHWLRLPWVLRKRIYEAYVPGQEITKTPSAAYIAAAKEVQQWIRLWEAHNERHQLDRA